MAMSENAKAFMQKLFATAGITINGHEPWDIQIHNPRFYSRVLQQGMLGLGESYMDKWWDCHRLDQFFDRIVRARVNKRAHIPTSILFKQIVARLFNLQSKYRARQVAHKHYDLGNDLFQAMLDRRMIYTCGYWKEAKTLEEAQIAKLELVCQKLQLTPGLRLLDIGCGWGGLMRYAAEKYGISAVGITISKEQVQYAKDYCRGLPIDIRLQDYRDINEPFDCIVSVGMFEAVGHLNYRTFMEAVHRCLKSQGLFLLHTIGANETNYAASAWITKYIFPNGMLPSIAQIGKASEKFFVMEDWHNFGSDYDPTLMAWYHNFVAHRDQLKDRYDERFYRMWSYYLLSCAGLFRARAIQLWQIVFSKQGSVGKYIAPR